jgi:hypothetical protein
MLWRAMAAWRTTAAALPDRGSSCLRGCRYPEGDCNLLIVSLMVDQDASSEAIQHTMFIECNEDNGHVTGKRPCRQPC